MRIRYKCYYQLIYKKDNGELDIRTRDICIGALARGCKNLEDCKMKCRSKGICLPIMLIENVLMEFEEQKFTWRDVVEIDGKYYAEEFPISGLMDSEDVYQIDDFLDSVGRKYNVYPGNIKTYMMDGIDFDPKKLNFGAESCGCYINGVPEECYE